MNFQFLLTFYCTAHAASSFSVELAFITALCLQHLTPLMQREPSWRWPCSWLLKCFQGFITIWVNAFLFVSVALMHIYITLETMVKRYKDQLRGVISQLQENASIGLPVLFIGHTLWQPNSSPAYPYSLGSVKQLGQFYKAAWTVLLSIIP